jgi:hypothetical protein
MIYSRSGLAEEGAVFSTPQEGEADTVWVVTRHDPQRREVQFARFTHKSRVCVLNIAVHQAEESRSHVDIDYTFTAIAPGGIRFRGGLHRSGLSGGRYVLGAVHEPLPGEGHPTEKVTTAQPPSQNPNNAAVS